jgi:hypothetical protein
MRVKCNFPEIFFNPRQGLLDVGSPWRRFTAVGLSKGARTTKRKDFTAIYEAKTSSPSLFR